MSNSPKKQNNNNRGDADGSGNSGRRILFLVIAALIGTLLINTLYTSLSKSYLVEITYDEFLTLLDEDKVSEVEFMTDDRLEILTKEEAAKAKAQQRVYYTGLIPNMDTAELVSQLTARGVKFDREIVEQASPIVSFILTWVLPVAFMYLLFSLLMRSMSKRMGGICLLYTSPHIRISA